MKQFLKNERGGSLVTVLMVMLVFTVIGTGLIGMTVNSAKQVSGTNQSIQSTNLAEMGIAHVENDIKTILEANPAATLKESIQAVQSTVATGETHPDPDNPNAAYSIQSPETSGVNLVDKDGNKVGERLTVTFISHGARGEDRSRDIKTIISITRMGNTNPIYGSSDQVELIRDTETYKTTKTFPQAFVHYEKNLLLNPPTTLTYNHNLIVDGAITMNANTDILVKKDAHIKGDMSVKTNKPGNGNLGNFCVEGTLYYYGNPDTLDAELITSGCNSVSKQNGVFARDIEYRSGDSTSPLVWDIQEMSTQTSY